MNKLQELIAQKQAEVMRNRAELAETASAFPLRGPIQLRSLEEELDRLEPSDEDLIETANSMDDLVEPDEIQDLLFGAPVEFEDRSSQEMGVSSDQLDGLASQMLRRFLGGDDFI